MEQNIYEAIVEAGRKEERIALATIVSRTGSTPRKDAAKMLVFEDGRQIGTIGGGCSEAEVSRAALLAMRTGRPQMLRFDLSDDDLENSGLICGGSMEVYVEPILPRPALYILGAGHVGRCLAELARPLGFNLSVVDDRVKYANRERFPQADAIHAGAWEEVLPQLPVRDTSYLVIVTRGHAYDLVCLRFALRSPARYIGMMGSRRKIGIFIEKLRSEGIPAEEFARVYAPVGIEIGSETPEEIAVSIAAELIAVRKGLPARSPKELSAPPAAQTQPNN